MRLSIALALALFCTACGGEEAAATTSPAPVSTPAPSAPCHSDADCRLESASGCACISVLASSPAGPGCPHPCVVAPCTGNEAFCDASSSTCRVRPSMP
ncbi:MAG: hypothetical protein K1X94_09595 [Sandaracinaceae bacterium]|nr:hypothetical protein [Sandaracinaceae bacterium]